MKSIYDATCRAHDAARRHNEPVIVRQERNGQYMIERESWLESQPLSNIRYPKSQWVVRVYPDGTMRNPQS